MNKIELLHFLEYSALAYAKDQPYCPDSKIIKIESGSVGVQCLIRKVKEEIHISFRGTYSFRDVLTDIKFWKKKIPYNDTNPRVRVHTGFIDAYNCDEVRKKIWRYMDENIHKVVIAGHSYGAALAVLCAVDLQYNFNDKDFEVLLFGCPRVGNRAFAKSYNKRLFKTLRVQNSNDAVTKIPFGIMGYKHVGIKIPIGNPRTFFSFSINSHKLQKYYENLWKQL